MNGKSTRRLNECIDALVDLLDHTEEEHDEVVEQPDTDSDTE
jgi:hypothetical protein